MTYTVKIPKSHGNQVCYFPIKSFQFSKFKENEVKHDKHNFKRGLIVTLKV